MGFGTIVSFPALLTLLPLCHNTGKDFYHLQSPSPAPTLAPPMGVRRIVGGTEAASGDFPYIVALIRKGTDEVTCSGIIYDSRHVLTAAHCFDESDTPQSVKVLSGVLNISDFSDPHRLEFDIRRLYTHEQYDSGVKHDISVLRINGTFPLRFLVSRPPIVAPETLMPYESCVLAGWGSLTEILSDASENVEAFPQVLNSVLLQLLPTDLCEGIFFDVPLQPGLLCAGHLGGGRDGCVGDSGGPLVCAGRLVGLMSAGVGCAQPLRPGVYLNLSHYRRWLRRTVRRSYRQERAELRRQNGRAKGASSVGSSFIKGSTAPV